MIDRPRYVDWLQRWKDRPVIKVVTGLRRCGKSSVLALFQERLSEQGVAPENILSINFESLDEDWPREAVALYRAIVERLAPGTNYVFLDEVQHVQDFERAVDALSIREDVDLYITGSNAFFLSGELATLLTGRYVELRMLPFSFAELRAATSSEVSDEELLDRYLVFGGLPVVARLTSDQDIADYLGGVFNTIVMEDARRRHPRMGMRAFLNTAAFLADNIGNITSQKRISTGLAEGGMAASPATVGEHLDALQENYLVFKASRYDVRGRAHLSTLEKYYLGDLGFRFWLLGKRQGDLGHRLENAIYLELLRRYRRVDVGAMGANEVDFVAQGDDGIDYYQVSLSVLDEATLAREMAPLAAIADNRPKTLLTLDRVGLGDYDGIAHANAIDWLLER